MHNITSIQKYVTLPLFPNSEEKESILPKPLWERLLRDLNTHRLEDRSEETGLILPLTTLSMAAGLKNREKNKHEEDIITCFSSRFSPFSPLIFDRKIMRQYEILSLSYTPSLEELRSNSEKIIKELPSRFPYTFQIQCLKPITLKHPYSSFKFDRPFPAIINFFKKQYSLKNIPHKRLLENLEILRLHLLEHLLSFFRILIFPSPSTKNHQEWSFSPLKEMHPHVVEEILFVICHLSLCLKTSLASQYTDKEKISLYKEYELCLSIQKRLEFAMLPNEEREQFYEEERKKFYGKNLIYRGLSREEILKDTFNLIGEIYKINGPIKGLKSITECPKFIKSITNKTAFEKLKSIIEKQCVTTYSLSEYDFDICKIKEYLLQRFPSFIKVKGNGELHLTLIDYGSNSDFHILFYRFIKFLEDFSQLMKVDSENHSIEDSFLTFKRQYPEISESLLVYGRNFLSQSIFIELPFLSSLNLTLDSVREKFLNCLELAEFTLVRFRLHLKARMYLCKLRKLDYTHMPDYLDSSWEKSIFISIKIAYFRLGMISIDDLLSSFHKTRYQISPERTEPSSLYSEKIIEELSSRFPSLFQSQCLKPFPQKRPYSLFKFDCPFPAMINFFKEQYSMEETSPQCILESLEILKLHFLEHLLPFFRIVTRQSTQEISVNLMKDPSPDLMREISFVVWNLLLCLKTYLDSHVIDKDLYKVSLYQEYELCLSIQKKLECITVSGEEQEKHPDNHLIQEHIFTEICSLIGNLYKINKPFRKLKAIIKCPRFINPLIEDAYYKIPFEKLKLIIEKQCITTNLMSPKDFNSQKIKKYLLERFPSLIKERYSGDIYIETINNEIDEDFLFRFHKLMIFLEDFNKFGTHNTKNTFRKDALRKLEKEHPEISEALLLNGKNFLNQPTFIALQFLPSFDLIFDEIRERILHYLVLADLTLFRFKVYLKAKMYIVKTQNKNLKLDHLKYLWEISTFTSIRIAYFRLGMISIDDLLSSLYKFRYYTSPPLS